MLVTDLTALISSRASRSQCHYGTTMNILRAHLLIVGVVSAALTLPVGAQPVPVPIAGPLVVSNNPNYFKDAKGNVLILNGSQTWNTFQDFGSDGAPQALDFNAFVQFLTSHGHNFTLLWLTELPKFCGFPATAGSPPDMTVTPLPWERTGPGNATDGLPKFDLTKLDKGYFDRLRIRVQALRKAGVYVGVYLFTGEWLNIFRCSADGFPFSAAHNINGADDGYTDWKQRIGPTTFTRPRRR